MIFLIFKSSLLQEKRWKDTIKYGDMSKREKIYPECIKMIIEKPILGYGPVNHLYVLGQRLGMIFLDTHNLFFWILTEVGIVGAIPFFIAYFIIGEKAISSRKGFWSIMPMSLFVYFTVINLGGTWHYRKLFWVIMAFISSEDKV